MMDFFGAYLAESAIRPLGLRAAGERNARYLIPACMNDCMNWR